MGGAKRIAREINKAGEYITIIANLEDQVADRTLPLASLNFEYFARVSGFVSVENEVAVTKS
eukprot:scaffold25646_cov64-Cyclotella_meneghiniana.AAC.2